MTEEGRGRNTRPIKALLREYSESMAKGVVWGHLLTDDFLLTGTVARESRGREAYAGNNFFKMVKGLRVKELLTEGDTGFALVSYDLISPKGRQFTSEVAELWKAKEGSLDSDAIYFDTAAFSDALA